MKGKTWIRALCLILCVCLLAGCGQKTPAEPEPTPEPTPVVTPEPTPEPLDAAALYRQAAEALASADRLTVDYRIVQEIGIPDYAAEEPADMTLREETVRSAAYEALGGDGFRAEIRDEVTLGDSGAVGLHRVYADGSVYLELREARYCAAADAEGFMAGELPLGLLDPELFDSPAAEKTAGGFTLRFESASEAGAWAMPADAELLEASGVAELNADGSLRTENYQIEYRFGGLTVTASWTAAYERPESLDLSDAVPADAESFAPLSDADAPMAFERALLLFEKANAASFTVTQNILLEAGATALRNRYQINFLNRESGLLSHSEMSFTGTDLYTGESESSSYDADYADGSITLTYEDGEEKRRIRASEHLDTLISFAWEYFPGGGDLQSAEIKEVGDYRLISFTATEEFALLIKDTLCKMIFAGNPTVLDDISSAYRTETIEGFLAVEKVSGIPTALNLSYCGIHTVQGGEYRLALELSMDFDLYTDDACKEIYDEPLPVTEPEQRPTPVFYEVTDGEGHTMYLFGTIHVGDDRTAWLPQVVYDAFDASDALAVEFDVDRFSEQIDEDSELQGKLIQAYYYTDGTRIADHIDEELYGEAVDQLKITGNYDDVAEALKPFLWSNSIEQFYLSQGRRLSSDKGVDNRLLRLARASEKEILDVESGEFQIGMMGNYTDPVQEMLLAETAETSRAGYLGSVYELYEAWCTGDEAALIEELAAMSEEERAELSEEELAVYDEYHGKMELERNEAMAAVAEEYLQSGRTVFFAVGLAHLLGENGLVEALRDAGYTVTLIDTHGSEA